MRRLDVQQPAQSSQTQVLRWLQGQQDSGMGGVRDPAAGAAPGAPGAQRQGRGCRPLEEGTNRCTVLGS